MSRITNSMATGGSPLNTVTPGAPTFEPGLSPPPPTPLPDKSPVTAMPLHDALKRRGMPIPQSLQQPQAPQGQEQMVTLPPDQNPQQPGTQVPLSEVELIIKAMSKHLDHKNKMEAKVLEAALPKQEQPQPQI